MTREQFQEARALQQAFFDSGATRDVRFRIDCLKKLRCALLAGEDRIVEALQKDFGKPVFETIAMETRFVLQEINHIIRRLPRWAAIQRAGSTLAHFPSKSRIVPEPYGRVLIISPWNYPFQLAMAPLTGALAAGNCITLKTARLSKHTSVVMKQMLEELFPPEHVLVLPSSAGINAYILEEKFDYIFFTGSPETGRTVMQAAAKYLTPFSLELGGKNPCVVEKDARLDFAARRIAWGKLINAGQTCISPDYLLVHESVKEELIGLLMEAIEGFFGPDPYTSPHFARIIDRAHLERLKSFLAYGKIRLGGESNDTEGYMAPTILEEPLTDSPLMKEEIFGPILPVLSYTTLEEAISLIRGLPEPLAAYIFTRNRKTQRRFLRGVPSGTASINDTVMQIANPYLPYGGRGHSGIGKYHGRKSFETFSHFRSLLINQNLVDIPLRYPPYRGWQNRLVKRFLR